MVGSQDGERVSIPSVSPIPTGLRLPARGCTAAGGLPRVSTTVSHQPQWGCVLGIVCRPPGHNPVGVGADFRRQPKVGADAPTLGFGTQPRWGCNKVRCAPDGQNPPLSDRELSQLAARGKPDACGRIARWRGNPPALRAMSSSLLSGSGATFFPLQPPRRF